MKTNHKWDLETLKADAANYSTRSEWLKGNRKAYNAAYRQKWLSLCCGHMREPRKDVEACDNGEPPTYRRWTVPEIKLDAAKYSTRKEWFNESRSAYEAAKRNGIFEECCAAMIPRFTWSVESLMLDAAKYSRRCDWKKHSGAAFEAAKRAKCVKECCSHMEKPTRWTIEGIREEASCYSSRAEWVKYGKASYEAARRANFLEQCCRELWG